MLSHNSNSSSYTKSSHLLLLPFFFYVVSSPAWQSFALWWEPTWKWGPLGYHRSVSQLLVPRLLPSATVGRPHILWKDSWNSTTIHHVGWGWGQQLLQKDRRKMLSVRIKNRSRRCSSSSSIAALGLHIGVCVLILESTLWKETAESIALSSTPRDRMLSSCIMQMCIYRLRNIHHG